MQQKDRQIVDALFFIGGGIVVAMNNNKATLQFGLMIMTKVKKIRFSLRSLLFVITIVALSLAIFFPTIRNHRATSDRFSPVK